MERYAGVRKLTDNRFLNLYQIDARTKTGNQFDYFFASRHTENELKVKTHSRRPEGMAICAICRDDPEKIVLLRQYRYPLNDYLYELPAGLIEPGETAEEAAVREMKEETGLDLAVYKGGADYYRNAFYLAQGLTDESGIMVYGYAEGSISDLQQEDSEDIEVIFADRQKARQILKEERVTVRAAWMLMNFLHAERENPFAFLDDRKENEWKR